MTASPTGAKTSGVIVFGSPVSVGHVRPLMPLARRLVQRGFGVIWAISGDDNEPASVWRQPLGELGVHFISLDETTPFPRGTNAEFNTGASILGLFRRIVARANDVATGAAAAIRDAAADRPIVGGVYDYFGLWAYVAMRRLGIADIDVVVSAFPAILDDMPTLHQDDALYQRELAQLRASGYGSFDEPPMAGLIPRDPKLRVLNFSSPVLCPDAPAGVQLLGVQADALPKVEDLSAAPEAHQALAHRLQRARAGGSPVLLLSMGTVVTRMFTRMGATHTAFLKRLYNTFASSALRAGAVVVASTCDSSAADLGVDEASLGAAVMDRVIAMPFVPQPFLFAHGLVDVMLMHGGANTFHEAVVSGIPLLVCPAFGDQESVARAVAKLGVGTCVESLTLPGLEGATSIDTVAAEVLPAMLAPGVTRWKAAALGLAEQVRHENGLDAAEALVLANRQ